MGVPDRFILVSWRFLVPGPDPHPSGKPYPDPHEKQDPHQSQKPDPHQSQKPDPYHSQNSGAVEAQNGVKKGPRTLTMELWRVCRPVVACSHLWMRSRIQIPIISK